MKIQFLVVVLLAAVLVTAGCVDNGEQTQEVSTKTYTGDGFSFEYPETWVEVEAMIGEVEVGDPASANAAGELTTSLVVNKVELDPGRTFEQGVSDIRDMLEAEPDYELLAEEDLTINGKQAKQYEVKFSEAEDEYQGFFAVISNDNEVILVVGGSLVEDFPTQRSNLELIINSIRLT